MVENTKTAPAPDTSQMEAEIRAKLQPGVSALYKAKKDYLDNVRKDLSVAPQYANPAVLNAKMATLEKELDNQIVANAVKGSLEGGNPTVYQNAAPSLMQGLQDKVASNIIEKIFSYIPFGGLVYDLVSKFIDVDAITDGARSLLGMDPKFSKDEKAMAGALNSLQKNPISLRIGRQFALSADAAAAIYDQRGAADTVPVVLADNHVDDGTSVTPSATPKARPQDKQKPGAAAPSASGSTIPVATAAGSTTLQ